MNGPLSEERIAEIEKAWAAASVIETSAAILGTDRSAEIQSCESAAIIAAWESRNERHPLDEFIAAEREKYLRLYRPLCGQWWTDETRTAEARQSRCVLIGLLWVRRGDRPSRAAETVCHVGRKLPQHRRDQAVLRMYHLIRIAGLTIH
jgi:hypothetical protein